ncbi:Panacea domain-containing protein [Priestia aryabhattai]|uniref:Panacea domain-containing protein n=1 Tax=Priestia aryabhattai TaxID=412384 RepID=UPI003D7F2F0C
MAEHFIILYSDYKDGKRIAYHKSEEDIWALDSFIEKVDMLQQKYKSLSLGFHHVKTGGDSWESVVDYDKFFSDVICVEDYAEFEGKIVEDHTVTALDVANLITTRIKCTPLQLQKLVYFFYCKYVEKYRAKPFTEQFVAWQYGPVVREIYEEFKGYGRSEISVDGVDDSQEILKGAPFKLSAYSRFLKTPIHHQVSEVVDETLEIFGGISAFELVNMSHVEGGPWDLTYREGLGKDSIIPHTLIEEYCN